MAGNEPAREGTDEPTDDVGRSLTVSVAGRSLTGKFLLGATGVALLLLAPAVLPGFLVQILTLSLILSVFAMSVDLLWGYTGILTFGHAVFLELLDEPPVPIWIGLTRGGNGETQK